MTLSEATTPTASTPSTTTEHRDGAPPTDRLVVGPGRWVSHWQPEDPAFWNGPGRSAARRNLHWSVFCEFLGFAVWQLWSVTVVFLPAAGFELTTSQQFWLVSLPPLVGAVLRVPYSFTVALFGGRNWTVISALLLLIPAVALALALSTPDTPAWVLYVVAATAGFGGGNFASSIANITFFFPAREKGAALGLNAAGGNLGVAVAQFVVPLAVTLLAFGTFGPNLPMAGLIWIPLILLAAWGAAISMAFLGPLVGFLALFTLTGIANGSSYRMIPVVFRLTVRADDPVGHERKASAAKAATEVLGLDRGLPFP